MVIRELGERLMTDRMFISRRIENEEEMALLDGVGNGVSGKDTGNFFSHYR